MGVQVGRAGVRRASGRDPQQQGDDPDARPVEVLARQRPFLERRLHAGVPGARTRRHLQVEPSVHPGGAVGDRHPVAHDQTLEAPLGAQDVGERLARLAGVLTVDQVVGAHDRPGLRFGDGDLEAGQVQLPQGALVDDRVEAHPVVLLVVDREVLQAGAHPLGLDAPHQRRRRLARQQRVLGEVLEVASARGVTLDVQPGPEQDAHALCACLSAQRRADLLDQADVPGRAERRRGRETGRRHRVGQPDMIGRPRLLPKAVRPVGEHDRVDALPGQALGVPEVGARQQLHLLGFGERVDDRTGGVHDLGRRGGGCGHGSSSRGSGAVTT